MSDFRDEQRVSRHHAAERLVDIAYALVGGETLELRTEAAHVTVPVGDDVLIKRVSRSTGDRVDVEVKLSWSAASGARSPRTCDDDSPGSRRDWKPNTPIGPRKDRRATPIDRSNK